MLTFDVVDCARLLRSRPAAPSHTKAWTGQSVTNDQLCVLVEAIAARADRAAFAELFSYFAPRLKGFSLRRGADVALAEELAQETLLTVWRKAATFDRRKATVSTWIFTIVRNKRIDIARRASFVEVELSEASDTPSDVRSPDDSLHATEIGHALRQAIQTLPKEQVQIVEKAFFEDKSHRAIADELGLPLGTVKSRIRLALARIRSTLPEAVNE
jgi:RNA polymerase sigma-70 factor (ECF subfamily)